MTTTATNRLGSETSPYLLQHAHNPVHWQPWDALALEHARDTDKPILLSVGYSACHWCHVMAHESFEDTGTAALMNELFVNIKIDREERPDLDKIYQLAHQMMTQRPGGWPLTMFLTPGDQSPFFGGTYFPKTPRHGLPAFDEILQRVAGYYREHREEIGKQAAAVRDVFGRIEREVDVSGDPLTPAPLSLAREQLGRAFDEKFGGFGSAPKFPHATSIERLLRHWRGTTHDTAPDLQALYMASLTLQRMATGGIYDQLGGGFCRYSVDDYWMIPHFEKMLYDNGPLLGLYSEAWAATNDPLYQRVAGETADWVLKEMQSPEGGYWSTLDADSEGAEGQFYAWTPDEVRTLLDDDEFDLVSRCFGLDRPANFEGRWHLHTYARPEELAEECGSEPEALAARLDGARSKLLAARERRVRPGRDEKVLTAWNGLMIRGMATAGRFLRRPDLVDSASRASAFLREHLWRDGRLFATYKDARARHPGFLDDYAFLLDGLLELLQQRWRDQDLAWAMALADALLAHFEDPVHGSFFFTPDDHETLLHRPRSLGDEATPSGNGIAARALLRLGYLVGEPRYLSAAERTLRASWRAMNELPHAHCSLLNALEDYSSPVEIVVIRGEPDATAEWRDATMLLYAPRRLTFAIPPGAELPAGLAAKAARPGPVAYVCRDTACSPPVESLSALLAELRA